jgi:hypothetical protein
VAHRKLIAGRTRAGSGLIAVTRNLIPPGAAYDEVISQLGRNLAEMRNDEWAGIPNLKDRPAWGTVHKHNRTVGGVSRDIWLIFLSGSPLVAYERLFIKTGLTPKFLAIGLPRHRAHAYEGYNDAIHDHWVRFAAWDGEFGRLLRRNKAAVPKLVIVNEVLGWPTVSTYYCIKHWPKRWEETIVHTTSNDRRQNPAPATRRGKRRVIVTRRPLTPQSAALVGAVVLSLTRFRQFPRHRWPQDLFAIISEPPPIPVMPISTPTSSPQSEKAKLMESSRSMGRSARAF